MKDWHEPWTELSPATRDLQRALASLTEEVEAINWYQQRADLAEDEGLRRILIHNRDEEIEHACMALEWLRRHVAAWDEKLHTYLFTAGEITELEEEAEGGGGSAAEDAPGLGLGIGKTKGE